MTSRLGLISVYVVHSPLDSAEAALPNHWLNDVGRAWRSRTALGFNDALLLVGAGFDDEAELRAGLTPFGLRDADLLVIDADEADRDSTGGLRERALAEAMEFELGRWLRKRHPSAIPAGAPPGSMPAADYGGEPWWLGLIPPREHGLARHVPVLSALIDRALAGQELAWLAMLEEIVRPCPPLDEVDDFAFRMAIAGLARWISGFRAATDDAFAFDYGDALDAVGVCDFRLGLECARDGLDEIDFELVENGEGMARVAAFRQLVQSDRFFRRQDLVDFFGGATALFCTMHAAFWPRLSKPLREAGDELVSLKIVDPGEIEAAWLYVDRGYWGDIE